MIEPKIIKNLIPLELIKFLDIEFTMMRDCMKALNSESGFNDPTVENSFSWYSPICFESLSMYILPKIEEEIGEELYPSYSFGRIYYNGSELKKHTDRKSSEITVSCCIRKDSNLNWPLYFEHNNKIYELNCDIGDGIIGCGNLDPHWRTRFSGTEHMQAFMQYVRKNGNFSHLKYDTRPYLASPYETTSDIIKNEYK